MAKQLKDVLKGVKTSKVVPGSTGKDPGVDYEPKAPNEQEFVKLHKTEKHADRVGNGDDVYQATNVKYSLESPKETKHGYKLKQAEKVNEAKEKDKCNMTSEGTYCPVHENADCYKQKNLKEVLTKKTSAGEIIHDFQKSKDKRFADKSSEERKRMALGAYYGMHPEKSKKTTKEDLAVPLLGGKVAGDESAEMAKTQLRALANKALHLAMQLGDEQVVEPWVQAKIAVAKDNVTAVHDYMIYGDHNKDKEEDEQTAPYDGSIDMTGAPRNAYPDFAADVNTGRNV
jgi:hypothetical protein